MQTELRRKTVSKWELKLVDHRCFVYLNLHDRYFAAEDLLLAALQELIEDLPVLWWTFQSLRR